MDDAPTVPTDPPPTDPPAPAPVVSVEAGNDGPRQHPAATSVGVSGANFAPSSEVQIAVMGKHKGHVTVGADGRFGWGGTIVPQLHLGDSVTAVVTTADGTTVEGDGEVFRGDGPDA